jgi:hypothetical protein
MKEPMKSHVIGLKDTYLIRMQRLPTGTGYVPFRQYAQPAKLIIPPEGQGSHQFGDLEQAFQK